MPAYQHPVLACFASYAPPCYHAYLHLVHSFRR